MQQIEIIGKLLSCRKWSMTDDDSGNTISGTSIEVAIPEDEADKSSDFFGFTITKMTGKTELFNSVDRTMIGKNIVIGCDMKATKVQGRSMFKPVPMMITLSK